MSMIPRSAFLKRMMFVALATTFLEIPLPKKPLDNATAWSKVEGEGKRDAFVTYWTNYTQVMNKNWTEEVCKYAR